MKSRSAKSRQAAVDKKEQDVLATGNTVGGSDFQGL
jgi:hypothetical protein